MPNPTTRETLVEYSLRRLGAPVIEVNVDEDQIEDRIDDALQFYQEYHHDATIRTYLKHQVTADDITNKSIPISDSIIYVKNVFPISDSNTSAGMFDVKYQMHLNDLYDMSYVGDLVHYEMLQQYISLLDMKLNGSGMFTRYNRHMNKLFIDIDWENEVQVDDYIIVECQAVVSPSTYPDIYNDMFLKQYATALIKQQWGANLIKFDGMTMPGGVTVNARQIFDDATEELNTIREQMQLNYETPVDFFVG
jgi:hypothetical protein